MKIHTQPPDEVRFRNPNVVYKKLCNFLSLDPSYKGSGLTQGGKLDKVIWNECASDRPGLRKLAEAIRENVEAETVLPPPDFDEDAEAREGRVLRKLHKYRERSPSLVRKKKRSVLAKQGKLQCEVCTFDFQETYGELGQVFIECHHKKPLSELRAGQKTTLKDRRIHPLTWSEVSGLSTRKIPSTLYSNHLGDS